jgi:hypothetical protein
MRPSVPRFNDEAASPGEMRRLQFFKRRGRTGTRGAEALRSSKPIERRVNGPGVGRFLSVRSLLLASRSPRLIRVNAEPTLDFALFVVFVQTLGIGAGFLLSLTAALRSPRLLRCALP